MLAALFAPAVVTAVIGPILDLFKQYQAGKITIEQLKQQTNVVIAQELTKVEQANADMIKSTYASFVQLAISSRLIRVVYSIVTLSQCAVLVWAQAVVPYLTWRYGGSYPTAGVTLEWGYALLVLLVGGGMAAATRPKRN